MRRLSPCSAFAECAEYAYSRCGHLFDDHALLLLLSLHRSTLDLKRRLEAIVGFTLLALRRLARLASLVLHRARCRHRLPSHFLRRELIFIWPR